MPSAFMRKNLWLSGIVFDLRKKGSNPSTIFVFSIPMKLKETRLQIGYQVSKEELINTVRSRIRICFSMWRKMMLKN